MGTSYALVPSLEWHLEYFISQGYDFGLAYSYLRPHWYSDLTHLKEQMDAAETRDVVMRWDALDASDTYITNPELPPRRVWDLYSNRVIPYYWWGGDLRLLFPVSHSWVPPAEQLNIRTPINQFKWPVPIPKDSSLECVRIELLNHTKLSLPRREYSWLDVLCLQQKESEHLSSGLDVPGARTSEYGWHEAMRLVEWKTDVPTIGYIYYRAHEALVYFNGLGRPFYNGAYDDPRHWFNRAWTVQEAVRYPRLGGAIPSSPRLLSASQRARFPCSNRHHHTFYQYFDEAFLDPSLTSEADVPSFSHLISAMRKRSAASELDRIAGLASLSGPKRLPIYNEAQSAEAAWATFVGAMGPRSRAHLFLWFPVAGNTGSSWVPSWAQVMTPNIPAAKDTIEGFGEIHYNGARGQYYGKAFHVLDNCIVRGFGSYSVSVHSGSSPVRKGRIIAQCPSRRGQLECAVVANHQFVIDETVLYTLIFTAYNLEEDLRFVVGVRNHTGQVRKLCVLSSTDWFPLYEFDGAPHSEEVVLI